LTALNRHLRSPAPVRRNECAERRAADEPLAVINPSAYKLIMTMISWAARAPRLACAALLPLALLAGCATPETRLRTGLVEAGLSPSMASCMAESMTNRLTTSQLRQLASLAKARDFDPSRTTVEELMNHIRALGDPEILRVSATAAIGCSLR